LLGSFGDNESSPEVNIIFQLYLLHLYSSIIVIVFGWRAEILET